MKFDNSDFAQTKLFVKSLKESVDLMIVPADHITTDLIRLGFKSERIHFIPNGVSIPLSSRKIDTGSKKVTFIGRLEKEKGIFTLIKAWEILTDKDPEIGSLQIVGNGNLYEALRKDFCSNRPKRNFRLHGYVQSVEEYLLDSSLIVIPSSIEGCPNVLLEAMSYAVPVVGSNIPGISNIISDGRNGLLFETGDSYDLAKKLHTLLMNESYSQYIGKNGRETIREAYSIEDITLRYLELF